MKNEEKLKNPKYSIGILMLEISSWDVNFKDIDKDFSRRNIKHPFL